MFDTLTDEERISSTKRVTGFQPTGNQKKGTNFEWKWLLVIQPTWKTTPGTFENDAFQQQKYCPFSCSMLAYKGEI